jgi:hypothetical protein
MTVHPRESISPTLTGDVLEIGPGHRPFPVGDGARVRILDRSVAGGRDKTWPELVGLPHSPKRDFDADLDTDGLAVLSDQAMDVVIASHVIEHLANPVAALLEFDRVLRPGGRLVLIVPDRHHTFDSGRVPTPMSHVMAEYRDGVTVVSDAHIREFCTAIFAGPNTHPDEVRAWHDPDRLTDELFSLHRRRTIHVHVWDPQEFATLLTGVVAEGLVAWRLRSAYFVDDIVGPMRNECGFVLEKVEEGAVAPARLAGDFVTAWIDQVLDTPTRDVARVGAFLSQLETELPGLDLTAELAHAAGRLGRRAGELAQALAKAQATLGETRAALGMAQRERDVQAARATDALRQITAFRSSRTFRVGRFVGAPLRWARRG